MALLCIVIEPLRGNAYFIAKLVGSGGCVLVHPTEECGVRFLPCSYGYATTVRRAQGASLSMGCIYFDQRYRTVGRGYGYVAASRFRTRGGCYLYGDLRRAEFLLVCGEGEDEVLERGCESLSDDDEDGRGLGYACEGNGTIFDCEVEIKDLVALDAAVDGFV